MAKEESLSSGTQHWSRVTCPIIHLDTSRAAAVMGPTRVQSEIRGRACVQEEGGKKIGALVIILGDYPWSLVSVRVIFWPAQ